MEYIVCKNAKDILEYVFLWLSLSLSFPAFLLVESTSSSGTKMVSKKGFDDEVYYGTAYEMMHIGC